MRPIAALAALSLLLLPPADARAADADDAGGTPPPPAWLANLPAVSDDGSVLAVANHESLGARGDERLLLDFIDVASDRLVRRIIVSDPDHPESRAGAETKARAVLAERSWVKLHKLDVREDTAAPWRQGGVSAPARSNVASGDGLEVQYREPALAVRDTTSSADLARKKEPTWSHPAATRCIGCEVCPAPLAILADAWADRLHGVLLVDLSFTGGSDICWEPPDDFHAVELPPAIPHP
jgi:hypothetical protein